MADLLERRWQLSIIYAALTGALRFNEFADAVAGISPRMLSERLRDLEAAGLVKREVIPSSPPTVEYRLTECGRRLARSSSRCRTTRPSPSPELHPSLRGLAGAPPLVELDRSRYAPGAR